ALPAAAVRVVRPRRPRPTLQGQEAGRPDCRLLQKAPPVQGPWRRGPSRGPGLGHLAGVVRAHRLRPGGVWAPPRRGVPRPEQTGSPVHAPHQPVDVAVVRTGALEAAVVHVSSLLLKPWK